MTTGFSSTGFVAKTVEEVRAEIAAELLAKIDPALDLSADQPLGQVVGVCSQREAILWELLAVLAKAIDPDAAEDWLLDAVCAITGTKRNVAQKSVVTLSCNVNDGFSATAGQIVANVAGQPGVLFTNRAAGPFTPAGVYPIVFESVDYGPIAANAGTLTVITHPVTGLNSIANALDAVPGALRESDASLRVRREAELAAAGACTPDAIRSDVLQVTGVQQCFVFENVTLATDTDGVPGKAFEVVVFDGTTPVALDADLALTIWNSKPSGAQTWGTTSHSITDATGTARVVNFSRATVRNTWLDFSGVVVDPRAFPANGIQLIKDTVAAYALKKQNLGVDVISNGMKAAAMTVPGVIDVPTLFLGFSASPVGTANLAISGREIASLDTSRINVTTVEGTP